MRIYVVTFILTYTIYIYAGTLTALDVVQADAALKGWHTAMYLSVVMAMISHVLYVLVE